MSHMTRGEYKCYILNKPQQAHTAKVKPKKDNYTIKDKNSLETLWLSLRSMFIGR